MSVPGRMEGRVAAITGAASGIGHAAALLFAAEGAHVIAIDRDRAGNETVVEELREAGGSGESVTLDLADSAAVRRVAAGLAETHGAIAALFNNAGEARFASAAETSEEVWDAVLDSNLRGHFALTVSLLPALRRAAGAAVVNNASIDGLLGHPHAPAYSLAKAAMIGMTRSLAYELGTEGIRINAIASGGIDTPMARQVPAMVQAEVASITPLGRLGHPDEVARVALFLASEEASFVSGAVLAVDGGRTAITQGVLGPG